MDISVREATFQLKFIVPFLKTNVGTDDFRSPLFGGASLRNQPVSYLTDGLFIIVAMLFDVTTGDVRQSFLEAIAFGLQNQYFLLRKNTISISASTVVHS